MKIKVRWSAERPNGTVVLTLEDVDCEDKRQWDRLSDDEKTARILIALESSPEQPYMAVNSYEIE